LFFSFTSNITIQITDGS